MNDLKYYKLSGKINFRAYFIALIIAILVSYYIGHLYHYLSAKFYLFIVNDVLESDIENQYNQITSLFGKALHHNKGGIVILVVLGILLLPFLISIILLAILMGTLREVGKSRNRNIDLIVFLSLSFICFYVSNSYEINSIGDFIELLFFLGFALLMTFSFTYYYCENCGKTYSETSFYTVSKLNDNDYIEYVIDNGIELDERYDKKNLLEKEDPENIYYFTLNKCDSCGSQIVKIENKQIIEKSDGKKEINDVKEITKDLIIS